jgi:hypothetical protein
MTHVCCPSCRLRFTAAAAAHLDACPACGEPPQQARAADAVGLRLVGLAEIGDSVCAAAVIALPLHNPDLSRC